MGSRITAIAEGKYGANTDLDVENDSTPVWSGPGETDWVYQQGTVDGSDTGITVCDNVVDGSNRRCDQTYIIIESGNWSTALICHETGHAAGLLHGEHISPKTTMGDDDLGCMEKPVALDHDSIGALNRRNINGVY